MVDEPAQCDDEASLEPTRFWTSCSDLVVVDDEGSGWAVRWRGIKWTALEEENYGGSGCTRNIPRSSSDLAG